MARSGSARPSPACLPARRASTTARVKGSINMASESALRSSIQPLGTNGDQRRRFLFHHMPIVVTTAAILVAFMTVPLFDASTYPHGDVVSGTFPQERRETRPTTHGADRAAGHGHGVQTASSDHHRGHAEPMTHGRRDRMHGQDPVAAGVMVHGARERESNSHAGSAETTDDRANMALPRIVQRFTVATGYLGVGFLALTLVLGPANLLLCRRNPVSTYLRRDVGIWTAVFSIVHVVSAVLMHVSHGSELFASLLHFFVAEDGSLLTNSFGLGNWTGLVATVLAVVLLVTSNDTTLRRLKARPWKWLQRLNYAVFVLVVAHAFFYGAFLRMSSPFTQLLILSVVSVIADRLRRPGRRPRSDCRHSRKQPGTRNGPCRPVGPMAIEP